MANVSKIILACLSFATTCGSFALMRSNSTTFDSSNNALINIQKINFSNGGEYHLNINSVLSNATADVVQGRTMLYLLVCDAEAFAHIASTGWPNQPEAELCSTQIDGIPYLHKLCESTPLMQSRDYETSDVYTSYSVKMGKFNASEGGFKYFFVDACETLGGREAILASCITSPPLPNKCFGCPAWIGNSADCIISPKIIPAVKGSFDIWMCDDLGFCTGDDYSKLPLFYFLYFWIWSVIIVAFALSSRKKKPFLYLHRWIGLAYFVEVTLIHET